jgi:hypothetical protein
MSKKKPGGHPAGLFCSNAWNFFAFPAIPWYRFANLNVGRRHKEGAIGPFSDGNGRGTDRLGASSDISAAAHGEMTKFARETTVEWIASTLATKFRPRRAGK